MQPGAEATMRLRTGAWGRWRGKFREDQFLTGRQVSPCAARESVEPVDKQTFDWHRAVKNATCKLATGRIHADGLALLQFIHG